MFKSNQFDPQLGRGPRRAAVELLERRIRALSGKAAARDIIGRPEAPAGEEQATISISTVSQGGRNTKSRERGGVSEQAI
jgi:hypothetical protein